MTVFEPCNVPSVPNVASPDLYPTKIRAWTFGNPNVVDPSPAPNVVPITAKSSAYVVLETDVIGLHSKKFVGAVAPA